MQITFEDRWDRREIAVSRATWPTLDEATPGDKQVRVPRAFGKRLSEGASSPVSLDALAGKPWVESVFAEWPCTTFLDLPGITSYFAACDDPVRLTLLSRLPNLGQLAVRKAIPEELAELPSLVDASFDWPRTADSPTTGSAALSALTNLERLQVRDFHYRERADPIAQLRGLRWLSLDGWRNLRTLGALEQLERLELGDLKMANLRAFRRAVKLRYLGLGGSLDSLAGIESMEQLEDVRFGGRVVRDLILLADLPNLRSLTLNYPDAVKDFEPIGRMRTVRRLEILLGDNTEAGELRTIDFLAGLDELEELILLNVDITDRRLDALYELRSLRRLKLTGNAGPDIEALRKRRPELEIETHLVGEPAGRLWVGRVHYDPPRPGIEPWSIFQNMADVLGVPTNGQAEQRLRAAIRSSDPALVKRLEFDTESGAVGIYAANEADIRAVAEIIDGLADG